MQFHLDTKSFTAERAWDARLIGEVDTVTIRLHWTDRPYRWHVNDGPEVFVVLAGTVDMHYRQAGEEKIQRLEEGQIFLAEEGDAHVAHPVGEARILVVERRDSV
ncbi:cupin [Roseibium sp. Sym1]|uniref:cupin n=1 Tax=Roseibium sp. Sym1 TaxID=3016006 RepID=UPI0022B4BA80|nr:cupin [Roseibium sp. Sym1]